MTSSCLDKCFKPIKDESKMECYNLCYDKYVNTLKTVHTALGELGYEHQSIYAYKAYPEFEYWPLILFKTNYVRLKTNYKYFLYDQLTNRKA